MFAVSKVADHEPLGVTWHQELRLPIRFWLAVVTFGAFALRVWNLAAGLPDLPQADESTLLGLAVRFGTGDLNPHYLQYPTLWPYTLFCVFGTYFVTGWGVGLLGSIQDLKAQYFVDPMPLWFLGRLSAALLGTATVPIVYGLGKRLVSRHVGLFAAVGLAVAPLHVQYSHYLVTDTPLTFMIAVALLLIVRLSEGDLLRLWPAALVCGLATSVKYSAAPLVFPLVAAGLVRIRGLVNIWRLLGVATIAVAWMSFGFLMGTPYAILETRSLFADVAKILSRAYLGFDAGVNTFVHFLVKVLPEGAGLLLAVLSVIGFLWMTVEGIRRWQGAWILMACFVIPYFSIIGSSRTPFARYMLPLLPVAMIYAGFVWERVTRLISQPQWQAAVRLGLVVLIFSAPLGASVAWVSALALPDTRQLASEWLKQHAPAGSVIVTERYGVPLQASVRQLEVQTKMLRRIADRDPEAARQMNRWIEKRNALARVHSQQPSFFVYTLELGEPKEVEVEKVPYRVEAMRSKAVKYVALSSYIYEALQRFPNRYPQHMQFYGELNATARLVFEISPLAPSCKAHPDILWNMETIDRSCIRHSGPAVKIFEMT